ALKALAHLLSLFGRHALPALQGILVGLRRQFSARRRLRVGDCGTKHDRQQEKARPIQQPLHFTLSLFFTGVAFCGGGFGSPTASKCCMSCSISICLIISISRKNSIILSISRSGGGGSLVAARVFDAMEAS